jgi:phage terminase Nu1 subunit (DNA packaging protein)
MPKGAAKGVSSRTVAKRAGTSKTTVNKKRLRGATDEQIVAEAQEKSVTVGEGKSETFFAAQARKEQALADIRELERNEKLGELVSEAAVTEKWAAIGSKFRDALMSLPSRIINRVPDEWRREVNRIADEEVRKALQSLSDDIRPDRSEAAA